MQLIFHGLVYTLYKLNVTLEYGYTLNDLYL